MELSSDLKNKLSQIINDEKKLNEIENLLLNEFSLPISNSTCRFKEFFCSISERDDTRKIRYSNSVLEISGYSKEELYEMPGGLVSLAVDEMRDQVKREYLQIISNINYEKKNLIYCINAKNGNRVWISESFSPEFNEKEELILFSSVGHDISSEINKILQLEKDLENSKKSIWQRDRFINIISHDLRSPFTSLLGFSEILLNEPGLNSEERLEYLQFIHDASKTQLQFINNLLDWARLQTGKINVELKRLNLFDLVSNCVSVLTHSAISKNIDIRLSISDDLFVSADERLIGSVLTNLISNAIKFSEVGMKVEVIADRYKEGMIEIIIKDTGIGISEENQNKIFKIEERFLLKGTAGEKGSGMGLILAKEIINKHNGDIWFYSKLNEGSEFHFTLHEAKNIILVVEDEAEIRKLYHYTFNKVLQNYEIIEASNGYEAMSTVFNQLPSLVITDHDMPLMSGTQLVEAIRKKDRKNLVPIIVISAKLTPEISSKYAELGIKHIISKPIDMNELTNIVKYYLKA